MGLGKTYSTSYLADSNNNTGTDGQVLISTPTGINWSDGSDIVGGPYLPLAGGTLTGGLVGTTSNFVGIIRTTLSTDNSYYSTFTNTGNLSIDTYGVGGYMTFSILGSEAMRIDTNGNVGIGTADPENKLHVVGVIKTSQNLGATENTLIYNQSTAKWGSSTHPGIIESSGNNSFLIGSSQNIPLHLVRNGAIALTLSGNNNVVVPNGSVGIGTTNPGEKLEVDGVIESPYLEYKPFVFYDFNSDTVDQWGVGNATLSTPSKSVTRFTTTGVDANLNRNFDGIGYNSPAIPGGQNQIIRIRYKWISGTAGSGEIFYATAGHGYSGSYYKTYALNTDGNYHTLVLDMSNLSAGGTDWIDNDITAIRFDLVNITPVVIDIDWIAVGGNGWGTQYFENDVAFMNGNVGIGTTSPSNKLTVYQGGGVRVTGITSGDYIEMSGDLPGYSANQYPVIKSGGTIHFANNNKYSAYIEGANTYFGILDSTPTTKVLLHTSGDSYFNGGNVGIGTTTTNAISGTNPTLTLGGTGISGGLILQKAGTDTARLYENASNMVHQGMSGVGHHFYVNAVTQAMVIDTAGNVGIGTTPTASGLTTNLEMVGGSTFASRSTGGVPQLYISSNGVGQGYTQTYKQDGYATQYVMQGFDGTHLFSTAVSGLAGDAITYNPRLVILNNGNVGIGTTAPTRILELKQGEPYLRFNPTTNAAPYVIGAGDGKLYIVPEATFVPTMTFSAGNVGIGTTSPDALLEVESTIATEVVISSTTNVGNTNIQGQVTFHGGLGAVYETGIKSIQEGGTGDYNGLAFYTSAASSTEKMRIDADGNVGIGTTSPGTKLEVNGNIKLSSTAGQTATPSYIWLGNDYSNGQTRDKLKIYLYNSGTEQYGFSVGSHGDVQYHSNEKHDFYVANSVKVRINSSGNVGIGTTSPAQKLDVVGKMKISDDIILAQTNGRIDYDNGVSTGALRFWSTNGGAERMRITSAGNVGIGTTSPYNKLTVGGVPDGGYGLITISSAWASGSAISTGIKIGAANDTGGAGVDIRSHSNYASASGTEMSFWTNSTGNVISEAMRITSGGNVGIGTDNPSYKLTVSSGTEDIGILTASSDSGSYVGFLDNSTSTIPKVGAVGNKLILDASQYVGVRRTDPSYALDVSGTIRATGNVIAYSDARVKENVETIPNALDKVKAMRGVNYNKIGEEKREIGVIAQEVLEVLPEVVHQDEQGMYSVAYGNIVGVLVEAIKELTKEVEDLKKQLK